MMIHRNQHQIRSKLYLQLGLIKNTPQAVEHEQQRQPNLPSCFSKRRSVLHKRKTNASISFHEQVKVTAIPSHRELDRETRDRLWNTPEVASYEKDRNRFEFWADGGDWWSLPEEEEFVLDQNGSLVHPATWARLQAYDEQDVYGNCYDYTDPYNVHQASYRSVLTDSYPERHQQQRLPSYRSMLHRRRQQRNRTGREQRKTTDGSNQSDYDIMRVPAMIEFPNRI